MFTSHLTGSNAQAVVRASCAGSVVFPGGFGTLDEMAEILTLQQTQKLDRTITVLLYGSQYWKEIINFDALVRHGMISPEDLKLFSFADDPARALDLLQQGLSALPEETPPAFCAFVHASTSTPKRLTETRIGLSSDHDRELNFISARRIYLGGETAMAVASQNLIHVKSHVLSRAIAVFRNVFVGNSRPECQALHVEPATRRFLVFPATSV
jgi:Possible lysine decarboxylase